MWSIQSEKVKQEKKIFNFLINKDYRNRFKELCQKRGWIMSVIVENNIKRLIDSV